MKTLSCESSILGGEGLDFQGMAGLSLRCLFWPDGIVPVRPLVHHQDEPAKLSLGMFNSQRSPFPFYLVGRL
jgi:hypothetical protein